MFCIFNERVEKMRKILLMIVVSIMVVACGQESESSNAPTSMSIDERMIEQAKAAVSKDLKDPSSAQFRNFKIEGGQLCGEVNAKNSMGGYAGFQRFKWYISTPDSVSFLSDTSTLCQ